LVVADGEVGGGGGVSSPADAEVAPMSGTAMTMAAAPVKAAKRAVKMAARDFDMIASWDFFRCAFALTRRIHARQGTGQYIDRCPNEEETGNAF
jgi:hypothetical protein